jgi:hypothetical protein
MVLLMKTSLKIADKQAYFIVTDADPAYQTGLQLLGFTQNEAEFVRDFPADAPYLERSFENFTRYGEALLQQRAGGVGGWH